MTKWGENPCREIYIPTREAQQGQQCLVNPIDHSRVVAHIGKIFTRIVFDLEAQVGPDPEYRQHMDELRQGYANRIIPDPDVPVNYLRLIGTGIVGLFDEQAINTYFVAIDEIAKLDKDADTFRTHLLRHYLANRKHI